MQKLFLTIGIILAGLAVILGAFGAHQLKKMVDPETVATYQTGVQYQMYHAIAIIIAGILAGRLSGSLVNYAGLLFLGGVVLFSGSLYLIVSMQAMSRSIPAGIGILTPIGGLLFIAGWGMLLAAVIRD
ncbi:MAG TPA: DUF423 domain-containing protein [Flavisolibacter sp.]